MKYAWLYSLAILAELYGNGMDDTRHSFDNSLGWFRLVLKSNRKGVI
jgi:hypothetical protein